MHRVLLPLIVFLIPSLALADAGEEKKGEKKKPVEQRVNQAIDKGVKFLKSKQKPDGTWPEQRQGFEPGSDALCLLALAKSGVHIDDPVMQRGFDRLLEQPFHKTYTVAVTVMAIEAAFCTRKPKEMYKLNKAWSGSRSLMPGGKENKIDNKRARKRMEEAIKWLLSVYNQELQGWRYTANDGLDHSHLQLVLLAFKAACRCGFGHLIPDEKWRDMLKVMIDRQQKTGPMVKILGARKTKKKKKDGSVEVKDFYGYVNRRGVRARGWAYDPMVKGDTVTGSMTCAGIAIVQLCRDEIWRRKDRKYKKKLDIKALQSIESGIAWMAKHFTVEENVFHPKKEWHYYYLYGIERVGTFCGLEKIGTHDWYREGAELLLSKQHAGGSWPDEEKTCYALLFLKRASYVLDVTGGIR